MEQWIGLLLEGALPSSVIIVLAGLVYRKFNSHFKKMDQLHDWHNHMDADGIPVWHIRQSFENSVSDLAHAIKALSDNSIKQTTILERMSDDMRDHARDT